MRRPLLQACESIKQHSELLETGRGMYLPAVTKVVTPFALHREMACLQHMVKHQCIFCPNPV